LFTCRKDKAEAVEVNLLSIQIHQLPHYLKMLLCFKNLLIVAVLEEEVSHAAGI
jgi:hypothetical protein